MKWLSFHIYHHHSKENLILNKLNLIILNQNEVAAENTVIDSAITLLNGLSAQIAQLKPDQAAIDALATQVHDKAQELANAVTANTPA